MLASERKDLILKTLHENHRVSSADLAARFGVSEDAIRRDLRALADDGLVRRVYGGALPVPPISTYGGRVGKAVEAKASIVRSALELIRPRSTICLDSGTTVAALAAALPGDLPLTVVTHSLPAALALMGKPAIKVWFLGGAALHSTAATVGTDVVNGYAKCRADACFLGVASVDAVVGIGVFEPEDAEMKRAIVAASADVVALASADKLGTRSPFLVGPASLLDRLITESTADAEHVLALRNAGVAVVGPP